MIEINDDVPLPTETAPISREAWDAIKIENVPLPEEQRTHKMDRGLKKIVERYKEAYKRIYGVVPQVEYNKPWLTVIGHEGRVTRQRLLEMARQLEYRAG